MASCFRCGATLPEKVYRNTLCESCGADAKTCLNCRFHDPSAHWECRETIAEAVREKDRANFCDFFSLRTAARPSGGAGDSGAGGKARSTFDSLFGDG